MGNWILYQCLSSKQGTCKMNLELEKQVDMFLLKGIQMSSFRGVCGGYWHGFMANSSRGT